MADDDSVKTQQLEELQEATNRLVRTVDGFQGDDWGGPSGLPAGHAPTSSPTSRSTPRAWPAR